MCEFKVGDEVVCVDDSPLYNGDPSRLIYGEAYTVEAVSGHPTTDGSASVYVRVRSPAGDGGWRSTRFRKVIRKNDSLSIEAFLTIKPGFEEPKRVPAKKRERV